MFTKQKIKEFFLIIIGVTIVAAAVYFFMLPSNVTVGSGTALAMVVSNFVPLPVSMLTLILNVFLLIIGVILVTTIYSGIEYFAQNWNCLWD